jgi:sugar lactone lactonase YvrE
MVASIMVVCAVFVAVLQLHAAENDKMPAVVKPSAEAKKVATGFKFTEGPAADEQGRVWFTDIPNNRIHRFDPETGKTEVMFENTQSCNGLMFKGDKLLACSHGRRQLISYDKDGAIEVLAETFMEDGEDKKFNSPNDLDIDAKGGIYFTDPRYGNRENMEMKIEGVYYFSPDRKLTRIIDDLVRPNGILVSGDGKHLYVADHGAGKVYAFDIQPDATVANKRLLIALNDEGKPDGDGMTLDARGNLYITSPGTSSIVVAAPDGKLITKIVCPQPPANCAFGGADRNILYITARDSFYRITLNIPGADRFSPPPRRR